MEKIRTVVVQNMIQGNVSIKRPEFGLNKVWSGFGQSMRVPFESLEQGLWDPAIRNMFSSGILYIENLQDKIDLGLEPADVSEPVNIILLDAKKMETLLKSTPLPVFKKEVSELTKLQVDNLIAYAIEHKIIDIEKSKFLKELTGGKDILKGISREEDIAEAEKKLAEKEKMRQAEGRH